jgi:integrase
MPGWILRRELTDGSPVYSIGYRVNGRTVKRKVGHTRREAEAALIIALADVEKGVIREHTTDRIDVYSARWLERRAPFVEPGTIQAYRNDFTYRINPTLGDVRLRDLTAERIEAAIRDMQQLKPRRGSPNPTYSAKTINNTLTTLAVMLGSAVSDGLLREHPARRQGGAGTRRMRIREQYREMHYLVPEEIPRFLGACDPDYADLAAVLALAGLRVSEGLALEPRDIDTRAGMIRVARSIRIGTRSHPKDKTPTPR